MAVRSLLDGHVLLDREARGARTLSTDFDFE